MILIGVVFTGDPRMQQVFRSNYGKAVRRGGGVPVFLPWKPKHAAFWAKHLDGFLFPAVHLRRQDGYELDAVGAALYDTPRGVEIQWDYSLNGHFVPET